MDDELAVGVGDGLADLPEEVDPGVHAEPLAVGPGRDRLTLDELHRQPRAAVAACTAVEDARDAGMVQPGEDPALGLEPPEDRRRVHPPLDELERDGLLEGPSARAAR